jgi:hypothetical protein
MLFMLGECHSLAESQPPVFFCLSCLSRPSIPIQAVKEEPNAWLILCSPAPKAFYLTEAVRVLTLSPKGLTKLCPYGQAPHKNIRILFDRTRRHNELFGSQLSPEIVG